MCLQGQMQSRRQHLRINTSFGCHVSIKKTGSSNRPYWPITLRTTINRSPRPETLRTAASAPTYSTKAETILVLLYTLITIKVSKNMLTQGESVSFCSFSNSTWGEKTQPDFHFSIDEWFQLSFYLRIILQYTATTSGRVWTLSLINSFISFPVCNGEKNCSKRFARLTRDRNIKERLAAGTPLCSDGTLAARFIWHTPHFLNT